jgi:hypothetical protein
MRIHVEVGIATEIIIFWLLVPHSVRNWILRIINYSGILSRRCLVLYSQRWSENSMAKIKFIEYVINFFLSTSLSCAGTIFFTLLDGVCIARRYCQDRRPGLIHLIWEARSYLKTILGLVSWTRRYRRAWWIQWVYNLCAGWTKEGRA